jgi:hypothetical protein
MDRMYWSAGDPKGERADILWTIRLPFGVIILIMKRI